MKALSQAIYSKAASSGAFWTAIGGRFYKNIPDPSIVTFPYVVFQELAGSPDDTFQEALEVIPVQFSIMSAEKSSSQVEDIYTALTALYDKCSLSITGYTHLHMLREFNHLMIDHEEANPNGWGWVWHYAVQYEVKFQRN